jgi:CBS domain-containing protein
MKAKDIMEPIKDSLSPDDTLREAVNKMRVCKRGERKAGVKGILVFDSQQNLVGMVSIKDILRTIMPSYLMVTEIGEFTWDGMLEEMAKKVADNKVADIMTKELVTVPEEAPLMECADFIVKHNLQRLPVVNKEKKVVGMIYVRDLYYAVAKVLFDDREVCEL